MGDGTRGALHADRARLGAESASHARSAKHVHRQHTRARAGEHCPLEPSRAREQAVLRTQHQLRPRSSARAASPVTHRSPGVVRRERGSRAPPKVAPTRPPWEEGSAVAYHARDVRVVKCDACGGCGPCVLGTAGEFRAHRVPLSCGGLHPQVDPQVARARADRLGGEARQASDEIAELLVGYRLQWTMAFQGYRPPGTPLYRGRVASSSMPSTFGVTPRRCTNAELSSQGARITGSSTALRSAGGLS